MTGSSSVDEGARRGAAIPEYEPRSAFVTRHLREAILSGRLEPGARIRQEHVARALGTSRIPVRQALQELRNEGLVTLTSHVGARVAALDLAELDEIYMLRERLEPLALSESVPRLSTEQLGKLREQADAMEALSIPTEQPGWIALDRAFHLATYAAAPRPRLRTMIEGLWNGTQQYRLAYTGLPDTVTRAQLEHRSLVLALERRDAERGAELLREHIRRTRETLERHPELFGRDAEADLT